MSGDFSPHPQWAEAQQDLALSCPWNEEVGCSKAGGGQVSVWQHLEGLDCPALCVPPAVAQPSCSHSQGCRGAELMENSQLLLCSLLLPLPSLPEHHICLYGMVAEHPSASNASMAMPTPTYFGTLGKGHFYLFFPIQFSFVAVHWTVGFSGLLGTDECLVSQNRVNSLLCLSLCLLLRPDQHSTVIEGLRETGTKSECWRRQDKRTIPKPMVSCSMFPNWWRVFPYTTCLLDVFC